MSDHRNDFSERLIDLAADLAAGSLETNNADELSNLDPNGSARRAFEAVAAEIDSAFAASDPVPMPDGLEQRLLDALPEQQSNKPASAPELKIRRADPNQTHQAAAPASPQLRPAPAASWFPWLVAAASLAITAVLLLRPQTTTSPVDQLAIAKQRDQLIENANPDALLRYNWTATEDPAVVGEVTGELVWDEASDRGFMTISGLQVNDPSAFQYQLWIFDATRPQGELPQFAGPFDGLLTQRPIDGGVFDITDTGEVVIPIDAKLRVQQGVAFAVTVEPPGGVVVSDRSRVPLLAIPG